jgi:hypothetical protein
MPGIETAARIKQQINNNKLQSTAASGHPNIKTFTAQNRSNC